MEILLTGASGYVGGRLLARLPRPARCLARNPGYLAGRLRSGDEVVAGDVRHREALARALHSIDTAYYLVHSLGAGPDFQERDRATAADFGRAARAAGVRRIIYLGGLGDPSAPLSSHLRSRLETGDALRESGVPVIEFRASIILGSGSLSFELIRALVERLPVMICPRWVNTPAQPIAIDDVIAYLLAALDLPDCGSRVYEIGGSDVSSYGGIMREYARLRGLRRRLIPVPLLTPRLSSLWLGLVTPVYARVGRPLVEGLRNPTVVRDSRALEDFPIRPAGVAAALERALGQEDREMVGSCWTDALCSSGWSGQPGRVHYRSRILEIHEAESPAPPARAFAPIRRIGGRSGWYFGNLLWRVRGWLDLAIGGPGARRGRRDPETPRPGSHIDFWRVEDYQPDSRLLLQAEMKLPGRAWLEFRVEPAGTGSRLRQTAIFDPLGLGGLIYWYALYPLHRLIFGRMLQAIARQSGGHLRRIPAAQSSRPIRNRAHEPGSGAS